MPLKFLKFKVVQKYFLKIKKKKDKYLFFI